jgi:hypothetical protein
MTKYETHFCVLCGLDEDTNKKNPHHVIPRRFTKDSHLRIWLCRFCHMILHKAEFMGLCRLPHDMNEYKNWKEEMKFISKEGDKHE